MLFRSIKRTAQDLGIKLVLVHLPRAAEKSLRSSEFISPEVLIVPELDHALEWCENEIIAQHQGRAQEEANLRGWFGQILGTEEDASELIGRCERLEVEAGRTIVRAGETADSMHFILDGRVGVMIPAEHGGTTRVRSLGRYTTIGEMGLVAHTPRQRDHSGRGRKHSLCPEHAAIRDHQGREPGARPEAAHLFRFGDSRAADVCQPDDRGIAEVAE